ncbi:MAG: DUF6036 family nucleotidyltransferase [Phycisphaerales bacterium]
MWNLAQKREPILLHDLISAIREALRSEQPDYRTRLLIRDAVEAITTAECCDEEGLGSDTLDADQQKRLASIGREHFSEVGFGSLRNRIVKTPQYDTFMMFFREVSQTLVRPCVLHVGGASSLILRGLLRRSTEDIDVVDELPQALRENQALLRRLTERYHIALTHFQSHYLPTGWESRTTLFETFGLLQVRLVDAVDLFAGKLFSRRDKDLDDLRILAGQLEKSTIITRVQTSTTALAADASLRQAAARNWYIVFGDELPLNL